jgi:hypothetical protein
MLAFRPYPKTTRCLKNAFPQLAEGNQPFEVHGKSLDDRRMPKQDPYLDVSHPSSFSEIRRSDDRFAPIGNDALGMQA